MSEMDLIKKQLELTGHEIVSISGDIESPGCVVVVRKINLGLWKNVQRWLRERSFI